jgi:hypothetical protein
MRLDERRSYGGAAAIETTDGTLLPDLLIAGSGRAILHARLALPAPAARRLAAMELPRLDDISVTDDRGARYALRLEGMSDSRHQAGAAAAASPMQIRVEPAPEPGAAWFELRHPSGPATRLLPSPQAAVRVGPVTPAAAGLPPAGSGMPGAAGLADGPRLRLDVGAAVPALGGLVTRLDSLACGPGPWQLFLRAAPEWFRYAEDGQAKWAPVSVTAQDDRGGGYAASFGGSSRHGGHDEVTLTFWPRLDPLARRLTLTLRGEAAEAAVVVGLPHDGAGAQPKNRGAMRLRAGRRLLSWTTTLARGPWRRS